MWGGHLACPCWCGKQAAGTYKKICIVLGAALPLLVALMTLLFAFPISDSLSSTSNFTAGRMGRNHAQAMAAGMFEICDGKLPPVW